VRLAVPRETRPGERRAAIVPEAVPKLVGMGFEVWVEEGLGAEAGYPDGSYREAGAQVAVDALASADLVARVLPPSAAEVGRQPQGSVLVGFLAPGSDLEMVAALVERKITSFAFELVPRISRAQSMDALSSQATVAGYRAALLAAVRLPKFFPMLMTAAGTVPPAKVLVMGAGVAGLQAIATARRLGAKVSAYDVRPAAGDEVRSLGATFLELDLETRQGAGGYAAEQGEDFLARQQELIATHVGSSDVVITTAAVPGRRAPVLIRSSMVEAMRPGSLVVDLAAPSGGNCELTRLGKEVDHGGVLVLGPPDLAATMPTHASALYARNVVNLVQLLVRGGEVDPDFEDEVVAGACLTADGEVRHRPTRERLESRKG
jgi:NAD(P) transhydrogenase subunit alpha